MSDLQLFDNKPKRFLFPVWTLDIVVVIYGLLLIQYLQISMNDLQKIIIAMLIGMIVILLAEAIFYWSVGKKDYPRKWAKMHGWLILSGFLFLPIVQTIVLSIVPIYLTMDQMHTFRNVMAIGVNFYFWPFFFIGQFAFFKVLLHTRKKTVEPDTESELQY